MYKRSLDGSKIVNAPANLVSTAARSSGSPTSRESPDSNRQPLGRRTKQWSPLGATKVSCPERSSETNLPVKRILMDLSRKMSVIRKRVCSSRYLDMSCIASADEIMAANQ